MNNSYLSLCLHLADNSLVLGHRNSEWTGHGPNLEQDIAISNIALDLIGQSRNFYQYAASLFNENRNELKSFISSPAFMQVNGDIDEDDLAYLRDDNEYFNCLLVEQTKGDWAKTILRQFLFSSFQLLYYQELQKSNDNQLASIAEKSLKEVLYHVRWSGEWVVRLGDGTTESHQRIKDALDLNWKYTGELFIPAPYELELAAREVCPNPADLKEAWLEKIAATLQMATLEMPTNTWVQQGGKIGHHTEYLGYLLAEMQHLQRTYPNCEW